MTIINQLGITGFVQAVAGRDDDLADQWTSDSRHWRFEITRDGHSYSGYYTQGSARTHTPTLDEILGCLLMDAEYVQDADNFGQWCNISGYDEDSRTAERVYLACKEVHDALWEMFTPEEREDLDEWAREL